MFYTSPIFLNEECESKISVFPGNWYRLEQFEFRRKFCGFHQKKWEQSSVEI